MDESSDVGTGFLSGVCQEWEAAAREMAGGSRLVILRFGIVLAPRGGALAKMLPVFRLGLGGKLGDGRQYWSWIVMDDLLRVMEQTLEDDRWNGVINAVSPHPVTNQEFTTTLGGVLGRPTMLRVPRLAVKLAWGQMGEEALLSSARVRPRRLLDLGFQFHAALLQPALQELLRR